MVGPHSQNALTDLEDTLSDQIAALDNAAQEDLEDAEASVATERERRAWHPLRAA
jgi:hypothetical protein